MRKFHKQLIFTATAAAMVAALGTAAAAPENAGPYADPTSGVANDQHRVGAPDHEDSDPGAPYIKPPMQPTVVQTTTVSTDTSSTDSSAAPAPDVAAAPMDNSAAAPSDDSTAPMPAPRADRN